MIKMLFLDDNPRRIKQFKRAAKKKLGTKDIHVAKSASEAILLLNRHKDFEWIFLDRDLEDKEHSGEEVVQFIINTNYNRQTSLVVHSWNISAGERMYRLLKNNNYNVIHQPGAWLVLG